MGRGMGWDGDEPWEGMRHGTEDATGCEAMDVGLGGMWTAFGMGRDGM